MKTREIRSDGLALTEIGFGCAPIGGLYRPCSDEAAMETLDLAWSSGIRYFDTAPFYGAGLSEQRLGRFLVSRPREKFVISTKVGRLLHPVLPDEAPDYGFVGGNPCRVDYDYSGDGIRRSVEASLRRTGLDRFDILYVHDIGSYAHGIDGNRAHMQAFLRSGIAALEDLKARGVIHAWGLGVNEVAVCLDVMDHARMDCLLLAGRYTLLDRTAEKSLLARCKAQGTALVIGGVFNSGILATGPVPGAHFDYVEAGDDIQARVGAMQNIAQHAGADLASVALRFPLHNPQVASVLIGSANPASLQRNLASLLHPLPEDIFDACAAYAVGR